MKKIVLLICVSLLWCMVSTASAGFVRNWVGNPDPSFCNPQAWDGGVIPGPDDAVFIDSPPAQGPVIDCDVSVMEIHGPKIYADEDQVMAMESGQLDAAGWTLSQTGNGTATVNISGGSIVLDASRRPVPADRWEPLIAGANSGTSILNISGDAVITTIGAENALNLPTDPNGTFIMNISDNAQFITKQPWDGWKLADEGTAKVNISDNAKIKIQGRWRNADQEEGYTEINMTGGSLEVWGYLSVWDDGSGKFDFAGGTAYVGGISFRGRGGGETFELNVGGTADVTVDGEMRLLYGGPSTSTAVINVSGGSLTSSSLIMGEDPDATCTLEMTGGTFDAGDMTVPGEDAIAVINLHGGTVKCEEFAHAIVPGDFDEDGVVAWEDMAVFVGDWLNDCGEGGGPCGPGDLDRSGVVDLSDYVLFASRWADRPDWHMDVCGGTMIIDGDVTARIHADIAAGHITACGEAPGDSIVVDFDNLNPGKTTIRLDTAP